MFVVLVTTLLTLTVGLLDQSRLRAARARVHEARSHATHPKRARETPADFCDNNAAWIVDNCPWSCCEEGACPDECQPWVMCCYAQEVKVDWRNKVARGAGSGGGGPPAAPVCQPTCADWNAGFGECSTYASGQANAAYCSDDNKGVKAYTACCECGGGVIAQAARQVRAADCSNLPDWVEQTCPWSCCEEGGACSPPACIEWTPCCQA